MKWRFNIFCNMILLLVGCEYRNFYAEAIITILPVEEAEGRRRDIASYRGQRAIEDSEYHRGGQRA